MAFAGDDVGAVVGITGGEGAGSVDDAGGIAEVAVAVAVVKCIGIVETQGRRSRSYVRGAGSRAVEVEGVCQTLKRKRVLCHVSAPRVGMKVLSRMRCDVGSGQVASTKSRGATGSTSEAMKTVLSRSRSLLQWMSAGEDMLPPPVLSPSSRVEKSLLLKAFLPRSRTRCCCVWWTVPALVVRAVSTMLVLLLKLLLSAASVLRVSASSVSMVLGLALLLAVLGAGKRRGEDVGKGSCKEVRSGEELEHEYRGDEGPKDGGCGE